ncbi:MAG TPA: hypothetical protein VII02_13695 [Gemmatimonadaceae bacterium]
MSDNTKPPGFDPLDPTLAQVLPVLLMDALLHSDVLRARKDLGESDPTEYHRRQYIRAVFAQLEGATFGIKQLAIPSRNSSLSDAELALLRGETYRLNELGEAVIGAARITLPSDMRFAFKMYAKSVGFDYDLPVKDPEWAALMRARKVRDRLMHPRTPKDLEITDEELEDATQAAKWFQTRHRELLELMMDQLARNGGMNESEVSIWREERGRIIRDEIAKHGEARQDDAI